MKKIGGENSGVTVAQRTTWDGGRIRYDARGRPTFVIERMIESKRYKVSTRTHTERAALEHLKRFESDPGGYDPRGSLPADPLRLDKALRDSFLQWSAAPLAAGGCANTKAWVSKQRRALEWWEAAIGRDDLRAPRMKPAALMARLAGTPDRATKIRVLKTLYAWMRTETHRITAAEDPTLDAISTPQAGPAQAKRVKVITVAAIESMIVRLVQPYRAALTVQAGTGWHTEETIRFAAYGWIERPRDEASAGTLVLPLHKRGDEHRSRVTTRVLEAAGVLLKHGSFSRSRYDAAVRAACKLAPKIEPAFTPAMMRHTVATFAIEAGAPLAAVADFEGHRSPATTKRFYGTHAAPAKVPTPL